MKRSDYLANALRLYDSGTISSDVYDAMLMNADEFCEDDDDDLEDDEDYGEIYP